MALPANSILEEFPIEIAGSTKFGQYPKISIENTFNMYISDDWLVPFPGYILKNNLHTTQGRAIFTSTKFNHMIQVSDNNVYIIDANNLVTLVGNLETYVGDVFIAENNIGQIGICDKKDIWVFDYVNSTFQKATLDFIPGHLSSQNGRFISVVTDGNTWRLTPVGNGLSWPNDAQHVGAFAEADSPIATVPIPGLESNLLVMGSVVSELWTDVGAQIFPYQKNTSFNIDYGAVSASTIDELDKVVIFLARNRKSGPVIMYSTGGNIKAISTDGIDFKFGKLVNPANSYGFLYKQDGHLFYVITFADPQDNLTLAYDINTERFFTLTDAQMNYHIAKRVAFFNNTYYFVSFTDGNTYNMDSKYTDYNGTEIPRVRVLKSLRSADSKPFITQEFVFTIEQGNASATQRVDLSLSRDGGESFGSYVSRTLNSLGSRQNILNWFNCGLANDLVIQLRFFGFDRFVASNGVVRYY